MYAVCSLLSHVPHVSRRGMPDVYKIETCSISLLSRVLSQAENPFRELQQFLSPWNISRNFPVADQPPAPPPVSNQLPPSLPLPPCPGLKTVTKNRDTSRCNMCQCVRCFPRPTFHTSLMINVAETIALSSLLLVSAF